MSGISNKDGKLVRDQIPDIIRESGGSPESRVLNSSEYWLALVDKLHEEVEELQDATRLDRLEEIADVFEVLLAIAKLDGHSLEDIQQTAVAKRLARGGFEKRVWLKNSEVKPPQ